MSAETRKGFTGHPAKLRNGAWGAHVDSDRVQAGDAVNLETKAGKEWDAVVERVVWTGVDSDGKACALITLVGKSAPAASTSAPAAAEPAGSADF